MLLMAVTLGLLHLRGDVDYVPASVPLDELPTTIGSWTATDIPLDPEVIEVLGKGVFLNRLYQPATSGGEDVAVGLFIGYFPTQRTGQSIHSPQHCLPGAGWVFDSSGVTNLTVPNGKPLTVAEYVISNGSERSEVLYWYRAHGRSIASDYKAKLYMLADSIRYNRTDAALVRVITPIRAGEDRLEAHNRAVSFAEKMAPLLPPFIPD
jgi:EpsI family protein